MITTWEKKEKTRRFKKETKSRRRSSILSDKITKVTRGINGEEIKKADKG